MKKSVHDCNKLRCNHNLCTPLLSAVKCLQFVPYYKHYLVLASFPSPAHMPGNETMLVGVYSITLHCFSFSLPSCIHTQVWHRSPCCCWWCEHAPTVGATEGSLVRRDQPPLGSPWGNQRESLHWEEWCCKPQNNWFWSLNLWHAHVALQKSHNCSKVEIMINVMVGPPMLPGYFLHGYKTFKWVGIQWLYFAIRMTLRREYTPVVPYFPSKRLDYFIQRTK